MASDNQATETAAEGDDGLSEETVTRGPLVDLLTPGGKVRILQALMTVSGEKLNPSGICERAAISRETWYDHRDTLVDVYGVIEEAGHAGNSPLYRVNMDDEIISKLHAITWEAADRRNEHLGVYDDADGE